MRWNTARSEPTCNGLSWDAVHHGDSSRFSDLKKQYGHCSLARESAEAVSLRDLWTIKPVSR